MRDQKGSSISVHNNSRFLSSTKAHNTSISGCCSLGSLDGGCIEKLLVHCGSALESHDVTLAQQVMWVLNNVASPVGDPNQRLTSWILRALISRASRVCPNPVVNFEGSRCISGGGGERSRSMSVTELAR